MCRSLICSRKENTASRWFSGYHTLARSQALFISIKRKTTNCCLGLLFYPVFRFRGSIPMSQNKAAFLYLFLETHRMNPLSRYVRYDSSMPSDKYCSEFPPTDCCTYSSIPSQERVSFSKVSRRITSIVLFSRSRPPITKRTGTPFSS